MRKSLVPTAGRAAAADPTALVGRTRGTGGRADRRRAAGVRRGAVRSLPAADRPAARHVPQPESAGRRAGGAALVRQSRPVIRCRPAFPAAAASSTRCTCGSTRTARSSPRRQASSPSRSRRSCRSRTTAGTTCGSPTTRPTTSRRSSSTRRSPKSSTCQRSIRSSACCRTSRSTAPSASPSTRRRSRSSSPTRRPGRAASSARWSRTAPQTCLRFDQIIANVGAGPVEIAFDVPTGRDAR